MKVEEESSLVVELKNGSESAFEEFVKEYGMKIKGMVLSYIGNLEAAEDIAQNVYLKVFLKIELFRKQSRLSTWVFRITMNEIFMHYRKNKKFHFEDRDETTMPTSKIDGPEYSLLKTELEILLMDSVQKLNSKEKKIFTYRYFEKKTNNDISTLLGLPVPTVKSRLFRGKKKLRKSNIGKYLRGEKDCLLTQCSGEGDAKM